MGVVRDELEGGIQDAVAELRKMRDQILTRLNRGSLDARDAWQQLAPRFDEVERGVERGGEAVLEGLRVTLDELRSGFRALREELHGGSPR